MNYEDEEKQLDEEIRAELQRLRAANDSPSPTFHDPAELRSFLRKSPVQKVARNLPVSSYVRKVRTYAEATVEVLAAALNLPEDILKQLESNESLPWLLPASVMAEVAEVFRLHMNVVEVLTKNSHTIGRISGNISDPTAARQSMLLWLDEVRVELQRRGAKDLID